MTKVMYGLQISLLMIQAKNILWYSQSFCSMHSISTSTPLHLYNRYKSSINNATDSLIASWLLYNLEMNSTVNIWHDNNET